MAKRTDKIKQTPIEDEAPLDNEVIPPVDGDLDIEPGAVTATTATQRFSGDKPNQANTPKTAVTAEQAETVEPEVLPVEFNKDLTTQRASLCIYFENAAHAQMLKDIGKRHRRASASFVVQQLVKGFLETYKKDPNAHDFEMTIKVRL